MPEETQGQPIVTGEGVPASTVISVADIESGRYQIETRVNGEQQVRPLKDVWGRAQKDESAERRLQDLHTREAELQEARDAYEFIRKGWGEKDGTALIKGLMKAGIPEEAARTVVYGPQNANPDPHTGGITEGEDFDEENEQVTALTQKVAQLEQVLSKLVSDGQEQTGLRNRMQETLVALDKHPELAKIIERRFKTPEQKRYAQKKAVEAVERRRQEFPTWGPRVIQTGLGDLLSEWNLMGISPDEPIPPTSLGPSDISESGVHLSSHARAMIDETKDDEYVSLFSEEAPSSIVKSIARNIGLLK